MSRERMTMKTAEMIRHEYQHTNIRQMELAKKYATSQRTVSTIVNHKSYMPRVKLPKAGDRYKMNLKMITIWVRPEDLPAVMHYDKTVPKPADCVRKVI
jgi:hypothetical protein